MNETVKYDISDENYMREIQDKLNYILNIWSEIKNVDLNYLKENWSDSVGQAVVNKFLENDIYAQRMSSYFNELQVLWNKYLAKVEEERYLNNKEEN